MRINSFSAKVLIIISLICAIFFYAQYQRNLYYSNDVSQENSFALKSLPVFAVNEIQSNKSINSNNFLMGSGGVFVHIWGTWCGPCEKEMPEILKFAESVKGKGIKFLFVAVNDDEVKVKKFLSHFPEIPSYVTIALDKENKVMDLFGTLKVPETFLFNSTGKHVNKFVGPQEWAQESYKSRIDYWLNPSNSSNRKIETH